ncbi:hypothetical protein E4T39_05793 [Aureobasidium subglaciale]|nr:hypothetical protein E4T39_05793 [Aureobasidium subglaciale]
MDQQSIMEDVTGMASRRKDCWRIQDCGSCLKSKHGCGWCPSYIPLLDLAPGLDALSSTNWLIQTKSAVFHLLCPLASERYELRTRTLGCNCSTTTFLSVIVTIFCTIAVLLLISGVLWLLKWWGRTFRSGGWEIVVEEDGRVREGTWRRSTLWPRFMVARR